MLFEDPYKNIHGQTVPTPGDATAIDPLGRKNKTPKPTSSQDAQGKAVGIFIFIFLIIPIFVAIATVFFEEMDVRDKIREDNPGDSGELDKYYKQLSQLKDTYKIEEIADGFSFDSGKIKFTPTSELIPYSVQRNDTLTIREVNYPSNNITVEAEWKYTGTNLGLLEDECLDDVESQCVVISDAINMDGTEHVLTRKSDIDDPDRDYSTYTLYYKMAGELITIVYEPIAIDHQPQADSVKMLSKIYDTLSENDDLPDVFQMASRLDMPLGKKIPSSSDVEFINFASRYVSFTTDDTSTNRTYVFTMAYTSCDRSQSQMVYKEGDTEIYQIAYSNYSTFVISERDTPYCYNTIAKYYTDTENVVLTNVKELIEAFDTLSDRL